MRRQGGKVPTDRFYRRFSQRGGRKSQFATHLDDRVEEGRRVGRGAVTEGFLEQGEALPVMESVRVEEPCVALSQRGVSGIIPESGPEFLPCGKDLLAFQGEFGAFTVIQSRVFGGWGRGGGLEDGDETADSVGWGGGFAAGSPVSGGSVPAVSAGGRGSRILFRMQSHEEEGGAQEQKRILGGVHRRRFPVKSE